MAINAAELSIAGMPVGSGFQKPAWRNWQTRWTQNPVAARPCGFEPLRRQLLHSMFGVRLSAFDSRTFKLPLALKTTPSRIRATERQS